MLVKIDKNGMCQMEENQFSESEINNFLSQGFKIVEDYQPYEDINLMNLNDNNSNNENSFSKYEIVEIEGKSYLQSHSVKVKPSLRNKPIQDLIPLIEKIGNILLLNNNFSEKDLCEIKVMFFPWDRNKQYKINECCLVENILYKCIKDHISQVDNGPTQNKDYWIRVLNNENNSFEVWDINKVYDIDDIVRYNDNLYISLESENNENPTLPSWRFLN